LFPPGVFTCAAARRALSTSSFLMKQRSLDPPDRTGDGQFEAAGRCRSVRPEWPQASCSEPTPATLVAHPPAPLRASPSPGDKRVAREDLP
jgi:hypothetical protein